MGLCKIGAGIEQKCCVWVALSCLFVFFPRTRSDADCCSATQMLCQTKEGISGEPEWVAGGKGEAGTLPSAAVPVLSA